MNPGSDPQTRVSVSPMKPKTYRFVYSTACNMCGSGIEYQTFFGRRLDKRQEFWPRQKAGITTSIFHCRTCGLIYPNPMPTPTSLEQHYYIAPEDYWGDLHFEAGELSSLIGTFTWLSGTYPHSCTALDIGAGVGRAMIALGRASFDVHGIEPSPSFRRAAIDRTGVPEGWLKLASVEAAELPTSRTIRSTSLTSQRLWNILSTRLRPCGT
jgi:hypothetical protein